jgi:hypothetical protein
MVALRRIALGALAAVGVTSAASGLASSAFKRRVEREVEELFAQASAAEPRVVSDAEIESLPEATRRWLSAAQVAGKPWPRTVRLKQEGEFRLAQDRSWMPFRAEEYYTIDPPGFVWHARMRAAGADGVAGCDGPLRRRPWQHRRETALALAGRAGERA